MSVAEQHARFSRLRAAQPAWRLLAADNAALFLSVMADLFCEPSVPVQRCEVIVTSSTGTESSRKLVWAKDSGSELQKRDARSLIDESADRTYLQQWADRLNVTTELAEIMR